MFYIFFWCRETLFEFATFTSMITRLDERSFNSAIDLFVEFGVLCARKRGADWQGAEAK